MNALINWESLEPAEKKNLYRYEKQYSYLKVGDGDPIMYPKKRAHQFTDDAGRIELDIVIRVVSFDEVFEILHDMHKSIGHGKQKNMLRAIKPKYCNLGDSFVHIFLKQKSWCQM